MNRSINLEYQNIFEFSGSDSSDLGDFLRLKTDGLGLGVRDSAWHRVCLQGEPGVRQGPDLLAPADVDRCGS